MNLNHQQLLKHLQSELKPIYLVSGDEPLLLQETGDVLRNTFKQAGFLEREIYDIDNRFHWDDVHHSLNSMSLFAEKKILELRFKSSKIGDDSKQIIEIISHLHADIIILITMPKMDKATKDGKWGKAVDNAGIVVQLWPIERHQLPQWITQRLSDYGINASSDAIQFLSDNVEGNLLAAKQEIEKLSLLSDKNIDLNRMTEIVSNSSRYNIFNLADRCLSGDSISAMKTLSGLQAEGIEATLILWCLSKELRILHRLSTNQERGQSLFQAMQTERIFQNRQQLYQQALNHLSKQKIERLLIKARLIDQSIKGIIQDSAWMHIEQLTLAISGAQRH